MELFRQLKFIRFNLFDYFILILLLTVNIISIVDKKQIDVISLTTSFSGILCVLLAAKGNITNFLFGLINGFLYAYVSYKSSYYGEVMLNLGFYVPMQFIGYYMWSKHMKKDKGDEGIVKTFRLSWKNRAILFLVCAVLIYLYSFVLQSIRGNQPGLDSASTILSVVAMLLAIKAYAEQWLIWITVNIISVILWILAYQKGGDHSFVMIGMWSGYFINSIYGYINWMRLSK